MTAKETAVCLLKSGHHLADTFIFQNETLEYEHDIEQLNAQAFGPGRFTKAAHLIREDGGHDLKLSFVALDKGHLIASVRMTPIKIGDTANCYLLGPIVVSPDYKNAGLGSHLMLMAIEAAKKALCPLILLVGDEPYYKKFGFIKVSQGVMKMPAPVNPERLLALALEEEIFKKTEGFVRHSNRG